VLTSVGKYSVSRRRRAFGKAAGRATQPERIYSQEFYVLPRAGGEVWIFGFYNNKKIDKKTL